MSGLTRGGIRFDHIMLGLVGFLHLKNKADDSSIKCLYRKEEDWGSMSGLFLKMYNV